MSKVIERIVNAERLEDVIAVFGSFDENIRMIEREYGVSIVSRGSDLKVMGDAENVSLAVRGRRHECPHHQPGNGFEGGRG